MKQGSTEIIEEITNINGKDTIVLSHKTPLKNNQAVVVGVLGISIDITDRKKTEKALAEAIQAKSIFMSIISHEIKGPLSNVIGILDMLRETISKDKLDKKMLYI